MKTAAAAIATFVLVTALCVELVFAGFGRMGDGTDGGLLFVMLWLWPISGPLMLLCPVVGIIASVAVTKLMSRSPDKSAVAPTAASTEHEL